MRHLTRGRGFALTLAILGLALASAPGAGAVTLKGGDLVVADFAALSEVGAVFRVDPATGLQTVIATDGLFANPDDVALEADGDILVMETGSFPSPFVPVLLRVDPATGAQTTVTTGDNFFVPNGVTVESDGDILISDSGTTGPGPNDGQIIRVDPVSGAQTVLSAGGSLDDPIGISLEADGDIIVGDDNAVVRVDPVTGAQTVVSSGGSFAIPLGTVVEAGGSILVADRSAFGGNGGIIRVDPVLGTQTTVSSGGSFVDPAGLALEPDGSILVSDLDAFGSGAVFRVNPVTGAQSTVSSAASFGSPFGLEVVPAECEDGLDNDSDGATNFPADPSCTSATDDSEGSFSFGRATPGPQFSAMNKSIKRATGYVLFYGPATISKLRAHLDGNGAATGSQRLRAVIYAAGPGGGPGELIAESVEDTVVAGQPAGFVDFDLPSPVELSKGFYWLGLHSGSNNAVARYSWRSRGGARRYNIDTFADGAGSPFGGGFSDDQEIAMYAVGFKGQVIGTE